MKNHLLLSAAVTLVAGSVLWTFSAEEKAHKLQTVSLRKMADSLHAVIAANRQIEAELRAREPAQTGRPPHAEVLRRANLRIQQRGAEFSYTLRSLHPINPSASPQTEVEQLGLESMALEPSEPFMTEETLGGRSYFTAVYADRATLPSCVECHNAHPRSPKQDYQLGDVMGAIVVRIPLEF
jgi:hypothetical protein